MAWTSSDLTIVETAIRTAMTEGIASVSIGGQQVAVYTLESLQNLRREIKAEIAASSSSGVGWKTYRTIPPGAG